MLALRLRPTGAHGWNEASRSSQYDSAALNVNDAAASSGDFEPFGQQGADSGLVR
jgi:hypothetical protein